MEATSHESPQRLLANLAAEYERSRRFLKQLEGSLAKRTPSLSSRVNGAEKGPSKGSNDHNPSAKSGSSPQVGATSPEPTAKPESAPSKLKEKLRSLFTRRNSAHVNGDVPRVSNSQVRIPPALARASTGRRSSLSYYAPCEASPAADQPVRDVTSRDSIDVPPSATALGDRPPTARRISVVHYGSGLLQQGRGLMPSDDPSAAAPSHFERPATGRRPSVVYFGGGLFEPGQGADLRVAHPPPSSASEMAPEPPGVNIPEDSAAPPATAERTATGRRSSVLTFGSCVFDFTTEVEADAAAAEVAAEDLMLSHRTASFATMMRQGGAALTPSNRLRSAHSARFASIDVVAQPNPYSQLQHQVMTAFLNGRQQTTPTLTADPPPPPAAVLHNSSSIPNSTTITTTTVTATATAAITASATTKNDADITSAPTDDILTTAHTITGIPTIVNATNDNNSAGATTATATTTVATTTDNNSANIATTTATTTTNNNNNAADKDPPPPPPATPPPPQPQLPHQQRQHTAERRSLIRPSSVRHYPSGSGPGININISSSAPFGPTVSPAPVQPPRLHPLQIAAAAASAPPGSSPISSPGSLTTSPGGGTPGAAAEQGPAPSPPPGSAPWQRGSLAAGLRRVSSRSMMQAATVHVGIEQAAAAASAALTGGGVASGQGVGPAVESAQGRWCGGGLSSGSGSVEGPSPRGTSTGFLMRSRGQIQPQLIPQPQPPSAPQPAFLRVRSTANGGVGSGLSAEGGGINRGRRASVVLLAESHGAALEVIRVN